MLFDHGLDSDDAPVTRGRGRPGSPEHAMRYDDGVVLVEFGEGGPDDVESVLAGALLSFSFSLDDTIISSFVSVAGASPWPVYVFSSVRAVLRPEVASVSTLLLLLTLFAIACVAIVLRRSGQSGEEVAKTMMVGG